MNSIRDPTTEKTWLSLRGLIDHIVATHHSYLRLTLQRLDRKSTRLNSSHSRASRMPSSA